MILKVEELEELLDTFEQMRQGLEDIEQFGYPLVSEKARNALHILKGE